MATGLPTGPGPLRLRHWLRAVPLIVLTAIGAVMNTGCPFNSSSFNTGQGTFKISPQDRTITVGTQIPYSLTFTASGSNVAVSFTNNADWSSSDPTVASIVATGNNRGQATALSPGTTTITANLVNAGVILTTTLTVTGNTPTVSAGPITDAITGQPYAPITVTCLDGIGGTACALTFNGLNAAGCFGFTATVSGNTATLGGTPAATGACTVQAVGTDQSNQTGTLNLTINTYDPLNILQTDVQCGAGVLCSEPLTLVGGNGPVACSEVGLNGQVTVEPQCALSINAPAGTTGVVSVVVQATSSTNPPQTTTKTVDTHIARIDTPSPLPDGFVGQAYSQTLNAQGLWSAISAPNWAAASAEPPGLSVAGSGVSGRVSGTPQVAGNYTFVVNLNPSHRPGGPITFKSFDLTVHPGLEIQPSPSTIAEGTMAQLQAFALFDFVGNKSDVTSVVTWMSSDPATVSVSNALGSEGQIAGLQATSTPVTITATAPSGATATAQVNVIAPNQPPVAAFTFTCNALVCDFDASGSTDLDGTITSYDWNFGDGNTGSGVTTQHVFGAGGTFTVELTVTDDDGAVSPFFQQPVAVIQSNQPPVAAFTFTVDANNSLLVHFDGTSSFDPDSGSSDFVSHYQWDFGDGNSATGAITQHVYTTPGTYTVTLTVTDSFGLTHSTPQQLTVVASQPTPNLEVSGACTNCSVGLGSTAQVFVNVSEINGADALGATLTCNHSAGLGNLTITGPGCSGGNSCTTDIIGSSVEAFLVEAAMLSTARGADQNIDCIVFHPDDNDPNKSTVIILHSKWLEISPLNPTIDLAVQSQLQFTATIFESNGHSFTTNPQWLSSDTTVATIGNLGGPGLPGLAIALNNGVTTITAQSPGIQDESTTLTVINAPQDPDLAVTSRCTSSNCTDRLNAGEIFTSEFDVTELDGGDALDANLVCRSNGGLRFRSVTGSAGGCTISPDGLSLDCTDEDYTANSSRTYFVELEIVDHADLEENFACEASHLDDTNSSNNISTITVDGNEPPSSDFIFTCVNLACTFDEEAFDFDGNIVSFAWDFGDGVRGSGPMPSHTYAQSGTYFVELTVVDDNGAAATFPRAVTVGLPAVGGPRAAILADGTVNHYGYDEQGSISTSFTLNLPDEFVHSVHSIELPNGRSVLVVLSKHSPTGENRVRLLEDRLDLTELSLTVISFDPVKCEVLENGGKHYLVLTDQGGGTHSFEITIPPAPSSVSPATSALRTLLAPSEIFPSTVTPLPVPPILTTAAMVDDLTAHPSGNYLTAAADGSLRVFITQPDGSFVEHVSSPYTAAGYIFTIEFNPAGTTVCLAHALGITCAPFDPSTGAVNMGMSTSFPGIFTYLTLADLPDGRPLIVASDPIMFTFSITITGGVLTPTGPPLMLLSIAPKLVTGPNGEMFLGRLNFFTNTLEIHAVGPATGAINLVPASTTPIPSGFPDSWVFVWPQ